VTKPARRIDPTDWMRAEDTGVLFDALEAAGGTVRFVGGCVRDALLGRIVSDIDVATDIVPEEVVSVLEAEGIRAVPTGIEHGTVTAIPAERPFQVTTLRHDVETDGRRAVVSYTRDWADDAQRRDFTMNALSADRDGNVFDYTGGIADLEAGRIRFIGDAGDRIREDYLRILRFFRFQASYGRTDPDPAALDACRAFVANVETLSGERVWAELSRLLIVDDPTAVLRMMERTGALPRLLPVRRIIDRFQALVGLEAMLRLGTDPVRRLAALIDPKRREASQVAARLRLSRIDTDRLASLLAGIGECGPDMDDQVLRRSLYRIRGPHFRDLTLLGWADAIVRDRARATASAEGWNRTLQAALDWQQPELPVSGRDALDLGVPEGPAVGELIEEVETWWVEQAFRPEREACLDRLRLLARRRGFRPR
jgi:poly(A) polymerase